MKWACSNFEMGHPVEIATSLVWGQWNLKLDNFMHIIKREPGWTAKID